MPQPGANMRPHVVPKVKKNECIYLLPLFLQETMLKTLAKVTILQSEISIHKFLFIHFNLSIIPDVVILSSASTPYL